MYKLYSALTVTSATPKANVFQELINANVVNEKIGNRRRERKLFSVTHRQVLCLSMIQHSIVWSWPERRSLPKVPMFDRQHLLDYSVHTLCAGARLYSRHSRLCVWRQTFLPSNSFICLFFLFSKNIILIKFQHKFLNINFNTNFWI